MPKVCKICKAKRFIAKCYECKDTFCFDHIHGIQYCPDRMKETERVRDICDECQAKYGYVSLRDYKR